MRSGSIERMFVLGIDPGLTRCGFGLVEGSFDGLESFQAVRAGVVETDPQVAVEKRLGQLLVELRALLDEMNPDAVVVERVFYQRNARTAIPVAQASGVAVALAGALELPVRQFTAQEVKLAVTGYGAASKSQVQGMVARLCGLANIPQPPDAADALALAITYFMTARMERRYPAKSPT
jgi:crossover junction endodeoxyribonuclease RuvC